MLTRLLKCSFVVDGFLITFQIPGIEQAIRWAFQHVCGSSEAIAAELTQELLESLQTERCVVWMMENGENFSAEYLN